MSEELKISEKISHLYNICHNSLADLYIHNYLIGLPVNPESGSLSFFATGFQEVTSFYIHETGKLGTDNSAWISGWDDSTNNPKGTLRFFDESASSSFATYNITGDVTQISGEFYNVPLAYIYNSDQDTTPNQITGVFLSGASVVTSFTRAGDIGNQGSDGSQGDQGVGGAQGNQGAGGAQGNQGDAGAVRGISALLESVSLK